VSLAALNLPDLSALFDPFPKVDPGREPVGTMILIQLARPRPKVGNILTSIETQETDQFRMSLGRVVALGSAAYRHKDTGHWVYGPKSGPWLSVGDHVEVPPHGGHRFGRKIPGSSEEVKFVFFRDTDAIGKVTDLSIFNE